jgi:uncharacterized protein
MKKLLTVIALTAMAMSVTAQAQAPDPKLEWATKAVALQQGPELERLVSQLADSASQDVVQSWGVKLRNDVPKEKLDQTAKSLNGELKKYYDDVSKIIRSKVNKASADSLIPAYMARFTLDELKQLVAFFESPAVKKYQAAAPELGNVFVNQLIMETRADVLARAKLFDDAAVKIVGTAPKSPAAAASKPAAKK